MEYKVWIKVSSLHNRDFLFKVWKEIDQTLSTRNEFASFSSRTKQLHIEFWCNPIFGKFLWFIRRKKIYKILSKNNIKFLDPKITYSWRD